MASLSPELTYPICTRYLIAGWWLSVPQFHPISAVIALVFSVLGVAVAYSESDPRVRACFKYWFVSDWGAPIPPQMRCPIAGVTGHGPWAETFHILEGHASTALTHAVCLGLLYYVLLVRTWSNMFWTIALVLFAMYMMSPLLKHLGTATRFIIRVVVRGFNLVVRAVVIPSLNRLLMDLRSVFAVATTCKVILVAIVWVFLCIMTF
jgi:hypothetical protein